MTATSTDLAKFLRGLRAVREFTSESVSDEILDDILDVGRWTSTGGNRQGTEVVVITDPGVKQKMGDWGAKPAAGAAVVFLTLKNEGPAEIKTLLGIPEDKRAVAVVPIGHIDRAARQAQPKNPSGGRKPLEQFAHRGRF